MKALIDHSSDQEGFRWTALRSITCCLLGGGTQHAATAAALELARAMGARLTALASIDPFQPAEPKQPSFLGYLWQGLRDDLDLGAMRDAARCAIEDFEGQVGRAGVSIAILRVDAAGEWPHFCSSVAGHDLAVLPARVGIDGRWDTLEAEAAARLASGFSVPVLRVSRRPLAVERILLVVDNTPPCRRLARTITELGLWSTASLMILPVGCDRPIVEDIVRAKADHLGRSARQGRVRVLAPLPLDFEAADLIDLASGFQAAVMGHLSHRIGLFDAVRNDVHEVVASVVPMILLPAGQRTRPA